MRWRHPAEAFARAADWLSEHEGEVTVTAVSWTSLPETTERGPLVHFEPV